MCVFFRGVFVCCFCLFVFCLFLELISKYTPLFIIIIIIIVVVVVVVVTTILLLLYLDI